MARDTGSVRTGLPAAAVAAAAATAARAAVPCLPNTRPNCMQRAGTRRPLAALIGRRAVQGISSRRHQIGRPAN